MAARRAVDAMKRIPRSLRPFCLVVGGWLALFLAVNIVVLLIGMAARWAGKDPRVQDDRWPDITNLRMVGDRLLVGGATSPEQYRELAERHVTLVIDMRTGGRADLSTDDPQQLTALGLDHAERRSPMAGRRHQHRFGDFLTWWRPRMAVSSLTAAGGVGRSTSIAATFEAAQGQNPSVLEQLATGPPTIEQIWFVATLRPNHPAHGISPAVAVVSRVIDAPRGLYGWVRSLF